MARRHKIKIKTPHEVIRMRAAGEVASEILQELAKAVQPGRTTLEIDQLALDPVRQLQASYKRFARVVVPRDMVTLHIALTVIQVTRIVKPEVVVYLEVVAVASVDVAGIEIQSDSPTVFTV